ncbi:MAG TPA: hypothetical protein VG101_14180 [Puia sp.]|jgi:hypothetical protein|nr:hypothetical protein [Puia sp.]
MSNEKADEFVTWRGRLTPPDALPEQGLEDKEMSWQRLAERLEKQPRRHNIAWWIAAACLILAFFLPATHLFRGRPNHPGHVATHIPTRIPSAPHPSTLRPAEPAPGHAPSHADPRTAQPNPAMANPATSRATPTNRITTPVSSRPDIHPINFAHPSNSPHPSNSNYGDFATITSSITPDTLTTISPDPFLAANQARSDSRINLSPHHTLRIVYLNELNNNNAPTSSLATRQPAFLRFGTAAATADWTTGQQNISILKIDISSPNH